MASCLASYIPQVIFDFYDTYTLLTHRQEQSYSAWATALHLPRPLFDVPRFIFLRLLFLPFPRSYILQSCHAFSSPSPQSRLTDRICHDISSSLPSLLLVYLTGMGSGFGSLFVFRLQCTIQAVGPTQA